MDESLANDMGSQRGARPKGLLLSAGALFSAVGVFASWLCCLLPITLGVVGVGASALGAKIEPFRPHFLGLTLVLLGLAFYQAYRPLPASCGDDKLCAKPGGRRAQRIALWTVTLIVLLLIGTPLWTGLYAQWRL